MRSGWVVVAVVAVATEVVEPQDRGDDLVELVADVGVDQIGHDVAAIGGGAEQAAVAFVVTDLENGLDVGG